MQGHLTTQQLVRYQNGICSLKEVSVIESHLNGCTECLNNVRNNDNSDGNIRALLNEFRVAALDNPTYHFDYEQVVSYVEDKLDVYDKENADGHLEVCLLCRTQIKDLQAFKIQLLADVNNRQTANLATYAKTVDQASSRESGWRRDFTKLKFPINLRPTAFGLTPAAIVAIVVIFLLLSIYLLFPQIRRRNEQISSKGSIPHANTSSNIANNQSVQNAAEPPAIKKQITAPTNNSDEATARLRQGKNSHERDQVAKEKSSSVVKKIRSLPSAVPLNDDQAAVINLKDGKAFISMNQEGEITGIDLDSTRLKKEVASALLKQKLPVSKEVNELIGTTGVLLSGHTDKNSFQVLGPVGTVVMSDRPTFNWSPVEGASGYRVTIIDSRFNVISSEIIKTHHWTATDPLPRGETYRWQVTAYVGDDSIKSPKPPAPEAKFKVLETNKAAKVRRLIFSSRNSRLGRAVIYAENGLIEDSENELLILKKENPQAKLVDNLIKNLKPKITGESFHTSP